MKQSGQYQVGMDHDTEAPNLKQGFNLNLLNLYKIILFKNKTNISYKDFSILHQFTLHFSPSLKTLLYSKFRGDSLPSFSTPFLKSPFSSFDGFSLKRKTLGFNEKINGFGAKLGIFNAWKKEGYLEELDDTPLAVELQQICSESQFDRVIAEAQQLEESLIILWMASWCRKCIYLKPKLEKLAADYYPGLWFYCVDVNRVPYNLVAHAGITLWRESKKQTEVIGGHQAYLVVNEVRD